MLLGLIISKFQLLYGFVLRYARLLYHKFLTSIIDYNLYVLFKKEPCKLV